MQFNIIFKTIFHRKFRFVHTNTFCEYRKNYAHRLACILYKYHSNNTIVRSCFNHAIVDVNSCMGAKFAFLQSLGVDIFKHKLCEAIQQVPLSKITVEQQADIENLRNLMFVGSEQSFIEGIDDTDIDCMIQYITGH